MFSAQITGRIIKSESRQTKFGDAICFNLETKNKKGSTTLISCIQYSAKEEILKGSLVFAAGELDISEYNGKQTANLLVRSIEIIEKGTTTLQQHDVDVNDEIPF